MNQHKELIQQALNNNEFDKIASINKDLEVLSSSLLQLPDILQRAQMAWQDSQQNLLKISQRLEQKVVHIDENVETLLAEFRQFMQRFDLSSQLKAGDEFTHHTSRSLELIQAAVAKLKLLPSNKPKYHQLIMNITEKKKSV